MKLSGKYITIPTVRRVLGMPGHSKSSFNSCIGAQLTGSHNKPHTKGALDAWNQAVAQCRGKGRG